MGTCFTNTYLTFNHKSSSDCFVNCLVCRPPFFQSLHRKSLCAKLLLVLRPVSFTPVSRRVSFCFCFLFPVLPNIRIRACLRGQRPSSLRGEEACRAEFGVQWS